MLQPLDVEHCLASLSKSIPTLQWWRFKLSKSDRQRHIWISLPANVEVVCGKTSLLPKNSQLLGRLNILHCGADCLIQGVRVTPSEEEQIVCIETRASEQDPRIFWIDVNQLAVVISPNGIQEIVDISKPTLPLRGSHIWGWLSGLEVPSSQSQLITARCFLIPVDFSNRDDIAVLLSRNTESDRLSLSESFSPSQKLIVVNPQTNKLYSCRLDSMHTSQTYSPFENMGSFSEVDGIKDSEKAVVSEDEEDGELAFPASMMDEEATKRDTKLSETLVEIEDFLGRVIWTIQHSSDGCVGRDTNIENQRCRIEMQLAEMQSCGEDLQIYESNASLSLLEKLLGILTCLLEISEMVNVHRRRDESSILRLVDQKLSDLTLWLDKSQSGEGSISLPQARHALNQLACIQSAVRIFVGTAKPAVNLEAMIKKVGLWVGERLESEIHEKLAEVTPCQGISLKVGDVLTSFSESMKEYLPLLPASVVSQPETPSTPLETLQLIRSSLAENMTFLKDSCGWIPCVLSEGVQRKLNISQGLIADLRDIYNHAFTTYKQLEMYTPLVCEHSGLYTLAVRLTNILERSTDEKLSQWEISQLEQDLDRCEAECAVEILSSSKENREFITMVVRSLLEYTSVARKIVNGICTIQEPQLSEWLERLNFLTSTSNRPCSSAFFEALLIGWYLQTRSFSDSQMDELVCQLEQEVLASFQDTPMVHLRISEMEEYFSRTPPICTPCNAEASSLRSTLQILSDVILRLNSAVQLLERMAFLTNLHPSQRLKTLCFAYPRALEGLTRCFRALDALLRELAEWRKCIILVEDSDQHDAATQAVIEVVNFAMDVITQELQRVSVVEFFNAPDFLSQILAWLSSFHASLIGFRKAICHYRLGKSAICSHSSALLHDLLNLEWLITDSRLQSSRDLTRDIGGTAAGYIKTSWMASIQKILTEIEPTKRRRLLNLLEGMERSSRERRRSLLGLLLGSREPVKIFEGVTMLNYIVARTEGFTDLEVQALEEKYAGTEDYQSNGYKKPNSNVCEEAFHTLMRNISEEFRHIYNKQSGVCDELKVAECLRKSEILVNIGRQCVATSRSSLHFINRVLFSHWPEALLKLITAGQLREGKSSPRDWRICALDFRNTVARCLVKGSFGFEKEGLPLVGTKDVDGSLGNLRMAIEEADKIFHGIHNGFSVETEDVWQACLRLYNLFQSYTSQLRQQINDLTLPSLSAIKKDLQHLDGRLNKLAQDKSSPSALDDCSHSVAHLEESLQALRQTARILFTCLSTNSQPSSKVAPSEHLDVNELYKRAVKLVNDYEASEIGCQILEAWQQLQSIADKLGRLQAGLPLTESFTTYEAMTTQSPMTSTSDIHVDGFSSASMARKRSWSLLEILGSHECLYPGCRGKKTEKHEIHAMNDGLLHDLHSFYSLLCSEFHDRAMQIPVEVLTSSTQEAASSEIALVNLRQEWYRDVGLVNQFNSLHRRVKLDGSGGSEVRSSFALIEDIWGEATPLKAVFEATERLATVSSWLCDVERHLELDVLPRLQTTWKKSSEDDTLSAVEECFYKMNEVAEDLEDLEKSGILAERHLKTVKHSLQAGWFSVREFLLNRCVEPAFHEDPTSARYFPLVDDFLRHSAGLGFQDCDLKAIHTRLCNQYLFHGLPQREHHSVPGGRKFCSTHRSLRSLFLPAWLTERCRMVQHRPPVALTIHSIPDIHTEACPPLSNTAELAFYSPNCIGLQSQRWLSLPNIRSRSQTRREVKKDSFSMTEDKVALNSPQPKLNEAEMKTSQLSFSVLPSEDERTEVEEEEEEPTISEDPGNSALMRDVRLLLAQLKSQGAQRPQIMDVNGADTMSEPNESEESKEEECSTILTPTECAVPKKVRDKSPITWCTVYLPNDEATELSAHPEMVTERGVVQMAADPLLPKREPYAPMVFSAPHEASDQEGGEFTQEEVSGDVEGTVECSPSTTLDESGVCDWLQNQQAENIRKLMDEYGAGEYDGDKADISLSAADDPYTASDRLDVPNLRTKNSVCDSFEESGFAGDEWLRRSHALPTQKTNNSLLSYGANDLPFDEIRGGRVNWGPLVERPESPHLSVISEASTDGSTLEKQKCIDEKLQKSSQEVSEAEEPDDSSEWKAVAPKKTRSRSNRAAKKMGEEEEERTEEFTSSSLRIPTFWDSEDKHDAPTPTQTSFGAKDGIQPQEGDSEGETGKTISEVLPLEVRVDGKESAASLQINMKSSSDSVCGPNIKLKPFHGEMVEQGAELVDGSAIERQDTELCAANKMFLQTTGKDENGFKEEPQSPEDGILEKATFVDVGSEDVSEPRDKDEINLVQRDAGMDYRQRSQEVNFSADERPPVEQTDTSEVNEQSGRGDFNGHPGKMGVSETNNEKISLNSAKSSTKPKRKLKKSRKKNSFEDPSTRVVSKPFSWNNVHGSAKFEGTDAITDGPSSTEQEVQILNEHKKGGNLLNGFQNAGKFDRGVATKPLAKKRKYQELINVREVSNSDGLLASKESGDVLSAVHVKLNHKAQIGVNNPEEDNLFDSTVVDVDEGQFASKFINDGLLVYSLQPDNEVKEETKLEQKCNGGAEVEKAKTDTKDVRSSLQKNNWDVKAAEGLLEEVHPVNADEPINPAVLSSKLDHHQMDQHCIDEGVILKNKEVLLISSNLWEGKAKKGILHGVDLTKWSDEKDAKRGQSVESIDDTKDDNTFTPTLKENACQDPEQSVALTTEMGKDRSCPEDANSTKKRKMKQKERDLYRKSGNKEAVLSANFAVSDKVQVGNEAVSPANEFNAYVDKDGLEIKPKLQSDLSDLDEDLLRHLEENVHSRGRKIEIQGGDMDTLEETSTEGKGLESNGLGTVDTWNDLLSSKEFETYSKEEKGKRITDKMNHLEGFGSEDVLRECTNEGAESQGHLAEARNSSDEIYQSGTIHRVDASSSSKAPEVPSVKGGKKKRHQRGRHIVSEVEVEECTTSTVPASREMSIIDAEVDHKAFEVAADVGHLMQPEETKGALDIIGDGQVLVLETEKQPSTVLKEASKQIQHQHVAGKLKDQLEDESQVKECDPEAGGETVDELRAVAEANVIKNLIEGEEGEHLQYEHAAKGVGGELQPQATLRWEDSEFQEHPVEGPNRLDEFDQTETIQRVDALSSPEVSEVPSIKSGKKKSKRHRKERHPFVVKVEAQALDSSSVLPAIVMADLNDEAELKITETFVDEQEFASDFLKEPQPIHHEVVVKELPEHPENRFQINDSKSDVQDESADESRAVGETSNLVSGYESKQHSAEQEKREKYCEEGGERTQDRSDVEGVSDESQPRANEEALKMSTDEGVETRNDLIEGESYVNEIVEPESNPIFGAFYASQELEGISVRGEGKKRHRKERYFQDEGEVETLEATADVGYPLEPEDVTKPKNIATNGKEFASGGSEKVSQSSGHDLMEEETTRHLEDEAQPIKHKLEVQGMSVDGSKPHLTEENKKNWDNEEREHWQGEGGNEGDEGELRPQENEDIWSETADERDAKPFKRHTEGEDNVNKSADTATIQGVDTLSSSQESETPPVKSKTKKQHRKKKQLLSEVEMVVGVELPIQTEEDKSALDVVVGRQGSVLRIGKHSQPNEQAFAVKESFSYLEGKPQMDECNLEVQRDLVNESRGIGEVDECEPHLVQKEKEQKHREEGKRRPDESEFEGVGDKSQVLTNEEDDEESGNSRLKVGDDIAETPRTTDVLPSSQEPEGLSMKIGEQSQHPEDSYLQNETRAQKLETSTALSLKELSGMVDEGEFETARTAVDEQRKEHHEEEGEDLLNESNVKGVSDDSRPQTNKGILRECTKEDVEFQKHPAQGCDGLDKIDKFETTYGAVILSSPEESEASSMKGGKKKRHRKKRYLMNKAEVEECTTSTVLASQEMFIMDAEAAPGVGHSLQSEEAKCASDIIADGHEPVSDIEKQPIVTLEGAFPPIRHEFVEDKSTGYPEDESQTIECESVVVGEPVNELKTVDKANDIEHFHVPKAHSEDQGKKWHRNEGEEWQKKRGTDTIGSESQPQRQEESPSQPTEGEDSLNVASKSEAIQDIGAMASLLEPETLSIRGEKGRKQRKKAFPQDEGVIQSPETVAEDENTLIIATEDGASSSGLLKKVKQSNVLEESSDRWEDVAQSRKYTLEDQNEIVNGSSAIDEADELEVHPGGQKRMQMHGEVEHCLNKSGVGDADDELQLQRNKETMREFTDEGKKTNKSSTKGGDNVELIIESEVVQGVEAVSPSQERDAHSLKRGRRAKHRKGRHPNAEAEAQECVTSAGPVIQGMAGANDEADLKVSEVAADVGYLMQPEEGKCTLDATVEEEKSASDALEEIPQSNEQELVEGRSPSHPEDGLHSTHFKWEISDMTVDEFKTVCQSDDLVHFHETDKKPWKQDEKLSHSEIGELWHDELCLEDVANATQPQTDARDLKDFTDEAAGSQENLRKGEIVASEAIPSIETLPSSQKLESPSINRKEKPEIEEESHQKGNSISSPEDQLSQKKGKTDLDSIVGGHLSTPQIYPDDQLNSNLDEFAGSDDLSNQHVKSDDEASQPRFEVREVPSHQGKKKPPRAEFSSDDYRDEKVSKLWTPSLPPPGSARETVTKDGLEIPGGRDDQFAICEPYSANSVGERSQALDFATTEDLTVAVEYTHSPIMKNGPKVDNLPCLSQDLSHDSDEDPSQTDNAMENEETVAVIGCRSTQEEMPMSVDISEPLNGSTLKLKPSQKSKESSKKKDKKRKHPKEKSPECGEPLEVVDVEIDERLPPEHESEAASTKCGKKKNHQREKYLKNVHTAEEDSKSLSTETKVENYPADKVVLGGEHVQITSTASNSREVSESFAEQVDKSNVPSVSLGTEGRSPVSKMEMELQKQPTAGSDVDRGNEDGKKSNQEGYNLEYNPELQNTEAEENLAENNLKQIESWKESELKECPGAITLESVGPNVTTNIPILGEAKEDNQRAKELSRNIEAQGKDEKELELSKFPDVDANKEQDDQQLKKVDNPAVGMEEEDEISLKEFPGLNELEFCQNHRKFGENSIDTGSKVHEANLSPNPDEEAIPVAVADEQAWKDEERLENRVGDVSDKYFELSLHPVKDVDVLEDLFVFKVSEASVNQSTSQKPPKSAMLRKESHQGSEITTSSDLIPSSVDVGIDDLQETESVKSIQKGNKEGVFEKSSPPYFDSSTAGDCSVLVTEEEKEEWPPYDSIYETEVYRPKLICTGLSFPQELGGKAAEADRSKKKCWGKVSTTKDTKEYLTPAVEVDEQPERVKQVDETLIPVDADTSQVVGADKDLVNKDISHQKDIGSASRELDSGGRVQGIITDVKTEEAFSLEPNKKREEKGRTAKGECSSTINPPEMSHLSNNRQRWPVNLQEMEREGTDVATDPQQSLGIEVPVEVIHPEMTSTPKEEGLLSSKSSTEIIQPSDVLTSLLPSSTRKKDVSKEPCVEADIESGRQVENVEEAEEEEDEGPVTSTDPSFTLLEQSPSDTDEVDDFTVVVKSPAPRTIIEAEAPAELITIPSESLQVRVKRRRLRWPCLFLLLLLFLLFFLIPTIIFFCITVPDFCFLPGPCPGLTLPDATFPYLNDVIIAINGNITMILMTNIDNPALPPPSPLQPYLHMYSPLKCHSGADTDLATSNTLYDLENSSIMRTLEDIATPSADLLPVQLHATPYEDHFLRG
ncbi:hypothetical protein EmuJ_000410300 [Echinococcus multilocularis]|uniref:Uncharacterized protein n=1 Tax=Echinococcus multilocularis TaxID=6211 RepID=A0A068Y368_ECHMU|nr:hypothetical protein EmuJ_000410300 [Echinococcus multilocularis]